MPVSSRKESHLEAQYAITRILAESSSLEDAAEEILKTICRMSDYQMGAMWLVDEQRQRLRCVRTWRQSESCFASFHNATLSVSFEKGKGLPGRIWASGQAAWIEDLAQDGNLPRLSLALADGIQSAFGFPIRTKSELLGILEFFSGRIQQPDQEFL